jgi:sulfatase modifying factor 1
MNRHVRLLSIAGAMILASCSHQRSTVTGWNLNDPKNGGFEVMPYEEQETGPGLVFIEGGTFTMGRSQDDVMYEWNNVPRRVTVSSFYMDETEVTNCNYREYLYWTSRVFNANYPQIYTKALPDTLVWRNKLAYNEPYVKYYLRHPAYQDYPVVGVNWLQATDFCKWRTDRVNEFILVREGIIDFNQQPSDADYFNTDTYLAGKWTGVVKTPLPDLNPTNGDQGRNVRMEDGIFLPDYRLPTEAEWEFAAYGLLGNTTLELIFQRRIYPWNGHATRNPDEKYRGQELGDFVKGAGDYMGVAGDLNDAADVTAPVYSYWPNDYGLYGMAGNVSEWVMDVYRPLTPDDEFEFRPFRGNQYQTQVKDQDGIMIEDSLRYGFNGQDSDIVSVPGQVKYRDVDKNHKEDNLAERRNYHESDERSFQDGDVGSSIYYSEGEAAKTNHANGIMYQTGTTTLISDETHVYKGGSWKDRAFWMSPGTRRFLEEHQATDYIGFRCAMTRVGSPIGLGGKNEGGKY